MELSNNLEVEIKHRDKVVAHMNCSLINDVVQIKDLFVREKHRGKGLDDILLQQVHEYAHESFATKIVAYCGAEPFCEDGQIPLQQEIDWYKSHGFKHDHDVWGVVPCMVKILNPNMELCAV